MIAEMLERAEKLLKQPQDFTLADLNALLEFHHIHQYFENDLRLISWTAEQIVEYKATVKAALSSLRTYYFKLAPADYVSEISKLEFHNRKNFWLTFRQYELYKSVDGPTFAGILAAHPYHIRLILPLKQITQHYQVEIRAFLLTFEESAELLLRHFEEKNHEPTDYHFPRNLTDADKHAIIDDYLASEEPNPNYVDLIRNSKHLKLPPKILLKAKRTSETLKARFFNDKNATMISVGAGLDPKQKNPITYENREGGVTTCYGGKYFDGLKSDLALFEVFSELFLYTDSEGLITLINKDSEMDQLEKVLMRSKNEYYIGFAFQRKNALSFSQLRIMDHYLKLKERSIEVLIQHVFDAFFKIHLPGLTFKMPEANADPFVKIRTMAPEIEYLLKQYKNFVVDGEIDHDLLAMDSTPVHFSDIPSLLSKKYIFSSHETIQQLQYLFFDPNSFIADRKDIEKPQSFFKTLTTEKVRRSDYENYQLPYLDKAIQDGHLQINEAGEITMTDPRMVYITGKLRNSGNLSYPHYPYQIQVEIDRLIEAGFLTASNKLFTIEEVSYLNFFLNMKEFSNGLDLRNKYLHGTNTRSPQQAAEDYLYFLRILILIMLKLKDDMELAEIIK